MDDPTAGMNYASQISYWSNREKPYRINKKTRRFPRAMPTLSEDDVNTDQKGNIIGMVELLGVPCFGAPIPWLRFAYYRYGFNPRTQRPFQTRCGRCKVAPACRKVVHEKLRVDAAVLALAARWLWKHRRTRIFANSEGTRLRTALIDLGPFESSNDLILAQRKFEIDDCRKAKDAVRQRRNRGRLLANGEIHEDYIWAAKEERKYRFEQVARYIKSALAPPDMRRIPPLSSLRTANVWMARQILAWKKQPRGNADIANWLIEQGQNAGTTYAVLRQEVPKHLMRVECYEQETLPGRTQPIWKAFDPEARIVGRP